MNYRIHPSQEQVSAALEVIEFSGQTTTAVTLPAGGTLQSPNPSTVTEIVAATTTNRSVFIHNKGAGVVHLYIGDVAPSWESSPESARRIQPGGFAESSPSSAKAKLSGWSEGGASELVVDVLE